MSLILINSTSTRLAGGKSYTIHRVWAISWTLLCFVCVCFKTLCPLGSL